MMSFDSSMRCSYQADLADAEAKANAGRLSPHWQESARRSLAEAREMGVLTDEEADAWSVRLAEAVSARSQPSDAEAFAEDCRSKGLTPLFSYESTDYYTTLELTYSVRSQLYNVCVYIDREAAGDDPEAYADTLRDAFCRWLESRDWMPEYLDEEAEDEDEPDAEEDFEEDEELDADASFADREEAILYVFRLLDNPDACLC